ncbi:hypothetical protein L8R18_08235 [Enterobacter kobei]|uniref:hypothetical protein n=1 Tax=Enterobacter kobei TaxID=208224 RepID=UPI00200421C2|nr:hypothetical protein [Enterobacter kobei]MCK6868561.1 hypothetical protein [Enterobacter kobei]
MLGKAGIVVRDSKDIDLGYNEINGFDTGIIVENTERLNANSNKITSHTDSEKVIELLKIINENIEAFSLDASKRVELLHAVESLHDKNSPKFLERVGLISSLTSDAVTVYPAIKAILASLSSGLSGS